MIPRKRFDIAWSDILVGMGYCLYPGKRRALEDAIEQALPADIIHFPCLSVRSGFDALLTTLSFEPGTEILVSAMTIHGMTRIIEDHGLVPIPIDLDMTTLAVCPKSMEQALTPRAKAILVAHLFGSLMPMEPILSFAQTHDLLVIEDYAQAYAGSKYWGHPQSDVSLFSFGPIKTATALAGGILRFRDTSLYKAVRQCQDQWPVQKRQHFLARICKYALLMSLSYRSFYSLFIAICTVLKQNHDRIIANSVRGFPGEDFFTRMRQRPSSALLALLARRLRRFNSERITQRVSLAEQLISMTPYIQIQRPGNSALEHTHWVFPILCDRPEELMHYLWGQGFDATQGGSSLYVVNPPANRPDLDPIQARQAFEQFLYLPLYVGMSVRDIERLASVLQEYEFVHSKALVNH